MKSLSRVRLLATPWTIAHQAPLSMGFSRQEYWSGLPCPPPGDLPNPGIKPRSPALQADSLPSESPGKPKNTGMGSLSLLQGIFLTQELNWDLLHCRRILYQLSYQGSLWEPYDMGKTITIECAPRTISVGHVFGLHQFIKSLCACENFNLCSSEYVV